MSGKPGIVITEPKEGEDVEQTSPADWRGEDSVAPSEDKDLGLRTSSPVDSSVDVSKASSVKSQNAVLTAPGPLKNTSEGVVFPLPRSRTTCEKRRWNGVAGNESSPRFRNASRESSRLP